MTQRIGDFLISIGAMTQSQVEETVKIQNADPSLRPFGEIALELGYVDEAAIQKYLEHKAGT